MFWAKIWKILEFFLSENSLFLEVIFSIYLNRRVFVMFLLDTTYLSYKPWRCWSGAAFCGVWSGSTLLAYIPLWDKMHDSVNSFRLVNQTRQLCKQCRCRWDGSSGSTLFVILFLIFWLTSLFATIDLTEESTSETQRGRVKRFINCSWCKHSPK